jgi:hypothetical protein
MTADVLLNALQRRFPVASPTEMVFLRDSVEDEADVERVREALAKFQGDRQLTQRSLNTFEIAELFGRRKGDTTEQEDSYLASALAEMWRARLQLAFPSRRVHVATEPPGPSSGVAIVFVVD